MTFDATETSDGRPVEGYEFAQAGAFQYVTNAVGDQVFAANTYTPLAGLTRSEATLNEEINKGEITVIVPHNFAIASQFRRTLPSTLPSLTVFRKHLNDAVEEVLAVWKGTVVSCRFGDTTALLTCQPITRIFSKQVPMRVYSATCNWQLYGRGCKVTRATYTGSALQITGIDAAGTTLTVNGLRTAAAAIDTAESLSLTATELDNFWQRGVVSMLSGGQERRSIVETDIGSDPNVVRVNRPFLESPVGFTADFAAGCNHRIDQDCNRKFKNVLNNGGFPTVPINNPFEIELDGGATPTQTNRRGGFF